MCPLLLKRKLVNEKIGFCHCFCWWLPAMQLNAQPVIISQPVNPTVVWGGTATFSVMATGVGPLTYQWQLNGTNLPNNLITTAAGGNLFNNQPATNTILNSAAGSGGGQCMGICLLPTTGNHVIRKVGTNGVATIVAGTGSASFSGDGDAATNAGLFFPIAVTLDPVRQSCYYGGLLTTTASAR